MCLSHSKRCFMLAAFCLAFVSVAMLRAEEKETLLFDFESPQQAFENADKLEYVPEHATQGKLAGKIKLAEPFSPNLFFFRGSNQGGKWGEYDQFVMDVFVEGGPVKAHGFARDKEGMDWWKRFNYEFKLQPGKRRLVLSLGALTRQNGNGTLDLPTLDMVAIQFLSDDPQNVATIYLDNARLVKGVGSCQIQVLFGFEGADKGSYVVEDYPEEFKGKSKVSVVQEHATEGKQALRLDSGAPAGNAQFSGFASDWSAFDTLALDVFNPSDKSLPVGGWVKAKDANAGWWERHNWDRILRPGQNTIRLPVGGMNMPNGGKNIDPANIVSFNLAVDHAAIFIDNVRLIKGTEDIPVAGLQRFSFGPKNSAVMPGFQKITKDDVYTAAGKCGWLPGGQFGRDFDINEMLGRHRPPDDLCRHFCQPTKATFAVDLPDGKYGLWLMLGPPGNGWGAYFKHRTVTANGKVVVDQQYDVNSFKAYEFEFQDEEDLPGDDLWEKYIHKLFQPVQAEVDVTGGQLKVEFDGHGATWCVMVNGLVLWPKASDSSAQQWLLGLEAQRKEQFQTMHVEKIPDAKPYPAGSEDKARGYVLFAHSPDADMAVNSVPAQVETKQVALELAGSPGEPVGWCVGLHLLKDCGQIAQAECSVQGPKALAGRVRVLRYKALNKTAVYEITPKYLDDVSVKPVSLRGGITRSFWITFDIPSDAPAGEYAGSLKLSGPQVKEISVPVKLNVWPIKLVEPNFPMGMFMMGTSQAYLSLDDTGQEAAKCWKELLADAHAHGLTSVDPFISLPLKGIANGKAEVDFSHADSLMELIKAAGFHQELNGYCVNSGLNLRVQVDPVAEAKRFGVASYAEAVKLYFDAVREHAQAAKWLPICFCTDDEYIVHPGGDPAKLAAHHRLLQENAPGFHFATFDSAYLDKADGKAEREKMLADIDTWGAGLHGPREAELTKNAGHRLWLYNTGMNRFTFGLYMFYARQKYNVQGFFQWVYNGGGTYNNFYLASHNEAHYGVVYPSTRGLRSTPVWERIRAGCYDHRYFETAWQLIAQAKAQGKGAAEAAALGAALEKAMSQLHFGNLRADAMDGEGKADNPLSSAGMEALRRAVAQGILALQKALE